ncbi:amidohydrolase family protein [Candidatus Poribacteria bacterium]|nr:amidohydrolase family protein [Candidatus Poribacteria bacterium]
MIKDINCPRQLEPWRTLIAQVAQHRNVFCKLSGIITLAEHQHWTDQDIRPYVEHVVGCFGIERVMFGSDWPVCLLAGSYERVIQSLQTVLPLTLTPTEEEAVFGRNAVLFYKLSNREQLSEKTYTTDVLHRRI